MDFETFRENLARDIKETELNESDKYEEISLEELLSYGEKAYWVCDSGDEIWQYYCIHEADEKELNVKIKKELVIKYLDQKHRLGK
ncbi:MAG: hypothetical protein E7302_15820 [Butyrivibrio sp.]|nr:hypothetical protein [Butyrivibrio sp.]